MEVTKNKVRNFIPDDIAFDILSKLPIKSLKRFTCVRKYWANLFENPQFMKMYRNNLFPSKNDNDHHNSCLLLKHTPQLSYEDNDSMFLISGDTFENMVKLDWPPPFQENHGDLFIVGSVVNGTVCLCQSNGPEFVCNSGQKVVLWNPSTEEFKVIPDGSFDHIILKGLPGSTIDSNNIATIVNIHGFGYDPVTNDYKLIRYFCFLDYEHNPDPDPNDETLWQIYSLKTNSWRDLQEVKMPNHSWYSAMPRDIGYAVYTNGFCHWWGYEDYFGEHVLVSFNLSDEVFIVTPLSDDQHKYAKHLVLLKGSIAMFEYDNNSPYIDISILGECGVSESWTKLFSIGPLPEFWEPRVGNMTLEPIGVGNNSDIFYMNKIKGIVRYNLNNDMIEETGVTGRIERCQIEIYIESHLPIGGIHS